MNTDPPLPPTARSGLRRLDAFILLHAVQRLALSQPLDDGAAMRAAHAAESLPQERLLARAAWLAREQGLDRALARWHGRLRWLLLLAALLVALMSHGLVLTVVGQDRQINAIAAWLAVLGPHLLMWALWLVGLLSGSGGGGLPRWGLGLLARAPRWISPESRLLLSATLDLLGHSGRLLPWAFGLLSHLMWAFAFALGWLALWLTFAFLSYRLSWESTILDASFFATFSQAVGWLPARLGFALPDAARLAAGLDDHRGWAWWLLGSTLVYGLLLRAVSALVSALGLRRQLAGLSVDASDPALRILMNRLAAMDAPTVIDAEAAAGPATTDAPAAAPSLPGQGLALVGFELPPEAPWPPAALAPLHGQARLCVQVDGSSAARQALMAQLQGQRPARLLLLCNLDASPDRGTARFLRALLPAAAASALLLQGSGQDRATAHRQRWQDWLEAEGLRPARVFFEPVAAQAWMLAAGEAAHG